MFTIEYIDGEVLGTYDTFKEATTDFIDIIGTDPDLYYCFHEDIDRLGWEGFAEYHGYTIPTFYAIYEDN